MNIRGTHCAREGPRSRPAWLWKEAVAPCAGYSGTLISGLVFDKLTPVPGPQVEQQRPFRQKTQPIHAQNGPGLRQLVLGLGTLDLDGDGGGQPDGTARPCWLTASATDVQAEGSLRRCGNSSPPGEGMSPARKWRPLARPCPCWGSRDWSTIGLP